MLRLFAFIILACAFIKQIDAQPVTIKLKNPSFEGEPCLGSSQCPDIEGWRDCGFEGETMPDIHPVENSWFLVTKAPKDGNTYLGLVVRENETWEYISQKLGSPMLSGVDYTLQIYLARSSMYLSPSRLNADKVNYTTPCKLLIYGGKKSCKRYELLAESELVTKYDWELHEFTLSPSENYDYLILEANYEFKDSPAYNGNLLLDGASDLVPVVKESKD